MNGPVSVDLPWVDGADPPAGGGGGSSNEAFFAPTSEKEDNTNNNNDEFTSAVVEEAQQQRELLPHNEEGTSSTKNSDDAHEGDEEDWESFLSEDVYSLLYTTKLFSPAFRYAAFWVLFQWTMLALVLYDLLEPGASGAR